MLHGQLITLLSSPNLQNFMLACRGYSTPKEKEAAKTMQGLKVITLQQFNELLQWGILMGVCDTSPPSCAGVH